MLKKLAVVAASAVVLAGGAAVVAAPAEAGIQGSGVSVSAARCHAHRAGSHWTCVTPGSYCPAARNHYGYAVKTGRRYRCVEYSNGR